VGTVTDPWHSTALHTQKAIRAPGHELVDDHLRLCGDHAVDDEEKKEDDASMVGEHFGVLRSSFLDGNKIVTTQEVRDGFFKTTQRSFFRLTEKKGVADRLGGCILFTLF
jgi:hypothetical protein